MSDTDAMVKEAEEILDALTLTEGAPINVKKTDILQMEFIELPIMDLSYRFLYRFLEPIETVWVVASVPYLSMIKISDPLYKNTLKDFAMDEWNKIVLINSPKEDIPEESRWLLEMKDCEIHECHIVRK